jgi:hypothetical protein
MRAGVPQVFRFSIRMSRYPYLFVVVSMSIGLWVCRANADVIYSQTDPFPGLAGDARDVDLAIFDDVVTDIPNPFHLPIAVTRVTYGIVRQVGAPAISVTGYYATTTNAPEFPLLNVPVGLIDEVALPEFGESDPAVVNVSMGNGIDTLFSIQPDYGDPLRPGSGEFAIGLQFSELDFENPISFWGIVDPTLVNGNPFPDAWEFDFALNEGFRYGIEDINTTFLVTIEGQLVPEPTSLALLGGIGILGLVRIRRQSI